MPFKKNDPNINREGRPKGSGISITTAIKRELEKCPEGSKKTHLELVVTRIIHEAVKGDQQTLKMLWNYIDGMPKQALDIDLNQQLNEEHENLLKEALKKINEPDKSDNSNILQDGTARTLPADTRSGEAGGSDNSEGQDNS